MEIQIDYEYMIDLFLIELNLSGLVPWYSYTLGTSFRERFICGTNKIVIESQCELK